MPMKTVPVDDIVIGQRFRKDVGDIDGLAESITECGLLHPVVVTPDMRLIAGFRRLTACRRLGWKRVPVRVIDLDKIVAGEWAENAVRKDFTLSEVAAIAKQLRPVVEAGADERRRAGLKGRWKSSDVETFPHRQAGKTRDIIARHVGLSGRTLDKIEAIVRAAEDDPARYGHLKKEMDRGGKQGRVNKLYLQLRHLQAAAAASGQPADNDGEVVIHHCDFRQLVKVVKPSTARLAVVDPPWGADALDLWPDVAGVAHDLLLDGGLLAVFTPIMYLPQVVAAIGTRLQYLWTMALFRGDPCPLVMNKQVMNGWRPVLLYSKGKAGFLQWRDTLSYSRTSWQKKYHPWEQNPNELLYLVEHLAGPGELVLDFFGGSFGAAVACKKAGRRYLGCDVDEGCVNIGRSRLAEDAMLVDEKNHQPTITPSPTSTQPAVFQEP